MKRFLIHTAVLVSLVLGTLLAVYLLPVPYKHHLAAILNKMDLLKDGRRNRIILVGGSGLYCGIDSEMLQKKLGRPVVNMGLYFGFGITPLLREIRPYLHPGDVVVMIPEYTVMLDKYDDFARRWLFTLAPNSNLLHYYQNTPEPFKTFVVDFSGLIQSKLESIPVIARAMLRTGRFSGWFNNGYVSFHDEFNGEGDSLNGFPSIAFPKGKGRSVFLPGYRDQSLAAVNTFCREAKEQGIQALFVFPAYASEEYALVSGEFLHYAQRLKNELLCPVVGSPGDFLYPYRFFADNENHLTAEGKRRRTERLVELLEKQPMVSLAPGSIRAEIAPRENRTQR